MVNAKPKSFVWRGLSESLGMFIIFFLCNNLQF